MHRNIANVVVQTDLNCLSVLQYAVDVLRVRDVLVCSHYGCGGVRATLAGERLRPRRRMAAPRAGCRARARSSARARPGSDRRLSCLCDLNVIAQVTNVCRTTVVEDAWGRGQGLTVHGLVYGLGDGLLRDLRMGISTTSALGEHREAALRSACRSGTTAAV